MLGDVEAPSRDAAEAEAEAVRTFGLTPAVAQPARRAGAVPVAAGQEIAKRLCGTGVESSLSYTFPTMMGLLRISQIVPR